jgi:hypothetical protein
MPFDPSDRTQLDTLFNQTQRGPFSDYAPDRIAQELTHVDLGLGGVAEDMNWPFQLQGFAFARIFNEHFTAPPPEGDQSYINDVTNKLPGWSFVNTVATGSGRCKYFLNSYGVGALQFRMDEDTQVGDRQYVEQTSYHPGGGAHLMSILADSQMMAIDFDATDYQFFIEVEWKRPNGDIAYTDTAYYHVATPTPGVPPRLWFNIRGQGGWVTIRLGVECMSTANLAGLGEKGIGLLYSAGLLAPQVYHRDLTFTLGDAQAHKSTAASTTYAMETVPIRAHEAAAGFRPPVQAFVTGVSCATDATITAGNIQFTTTADGVDANDWGVGALGKDLPSPQWGNGFSDYETWSVWNREFTAVSEFDFMRGEQIGMDATTNSTWASDAGCFVVTVHLAMVIAYPQDGANANYRSMGHDGG